jgi:hypothetical protein
LSARKPSADNRADDRGLVALLLAGASNCLRRSEGSLAGKQAVAILM